MLARKRWMTVEDSSELPFRSAHGCSPVRGFSFMGILEKQNRRPVWSAAVSALTVLCRNDLINQSVRERFLWIHEIVAVGV